MNFVLILFLAKLVVAISLVVAQVILFQSRTGSSHQDWWHDYCSRVSIRKNFRIMDAARGTESAKSQKGLKQRKSFLNTAEQTVVEDIDVGLEELAVPVQGMEMQRSHSGHASLKSQVSTSSMATENSVSEETSESRNLLGQPANFGTVVPGIYRSSYPREADYAFLQKLKLKTIV